MPDISWSFWNTFDCQLTQTVVLQTEVHVAIAPANSIFKAAARQTALTTSADAEVEPLETPDQADGNAKKNSSSCRQAVRGAKERKKAVSLAPATNGTGAFSNEMRANSTDRAVTNESSNTVDTSAAKPSVSKRKRKTSARVPIGTTRANVSASPAKKKCQGCIHGDLLAMTVMEGCHVKHYLKPGEFLEHASCAGKCKNTIKSIYRAAPRAKLYFCDNIIKGFRAPDNDPGKSDLDCGLILCVPCQANCRVQHNQEHGSDGSTKRRSSRCAPNK